MLEPEQLDSLRAIERATGAKPSEQIRRAIDEWIAKKGVKAERQRPASRKRP